MSWHIFHRAYSAFRSVSLYLTRMWVATPFAAPWHNTDIARRGTEIGKYCCKNINWINILSFIYTHKYFTFIQQLQTVELWIPLPMAKLVIPMEQHWDRLQPTGVILATTWWETVLARVKLMECGLGVNLPASVSQTWLYVCNLQLKLYHIFMHVNENGLVVLGYQLKVACSPLFSRSTNLEFKLIELFVLIKF